MAELLLVNPSRTKRKATRKASRRKNPLTKADAARVRTALKSPNVSKTEKAKLRSAIKAMHKADIAAATGGSTTKRKTKRKKAVAKTARKTARKTTRKVARKATSRKVSRKITRRAHKFTRSEALKYRGKSRRVRRASRVMGKRSAAKRIYGINPLNLNQLKGLAIPALAGAVGGFAINMAFDKLEEQTWCPDIIKTNDYAKAAAKAAIAVGASMALAKVKMISPSARNAALGGSLVIIAYDLLNSTVFPKVKEALGMHGYQLAGYELAGYESVAGLGEFEYVDPSESGDMAGLGYINSAPVVGFTPAARTYTG